MTRLRRNSADVSAEADLISPHMARLAHTLATCSPNAAQDIKSLDALNTRHPRRTYLSVYTDLNEIAYLVKIANRSVRDSATVSIALRELQLRETPQTYKAGSSEMSVIQTHSEYVNEIAVMTKAILEWFYHLADTLDADKHVYRALDQKLKRKLAHLALLRHKLVTHKHRLLTTGEGIKFYENLATLKIRQMPYRLDKTVLLSINHVFESVRQHLPTQYAEEKNVYERLSILAEYHNDLPASYKREVKSLVEKYGGECPSLEELTKFAASFAQDVLPLLAQ